MIAPLRIVALLATLLICATTSFGSLKAAETPAQPALHDTLTDKGLWRAYKARFLSETGRIVDTANGQISHSEGQGYGMLLAVAADDRAAFDAIWGWTRANLLVRGDELAAWRWEPDRRPAVADMNNATDGDLLISWALTEAAEAWGEVSYKVAARRVAVEIGRKLILLKTPNGPVLLPGMAGFSAEERVDGPVVNLSYYVFPALARLPLVAPEFDWAGLSRAGLRLLAKARFGPAKLPGDWISLASGEPQPAAGFAAEFSYNAIRIPLYLAWAGYDLPRHHDVFLAAWSDRGRAGLPLIDLSQGQPKTWLEERGYGALPALSACATKGVALPRSLRASQGEQHYYPVTLNLLAQIAARMRYPSCLQG